MPIFSMLRSYAVVLLQRHKRWVWRLFDRHKQASVVGCKILIFNLTISLPLPIHLRVELVLLGPGTQRLQMLPHRYYRGFDMRNVNHAITWTILCICKDLFQYCCKTRRCARLQYPFGIILSIDYSILGMHGDTSKPTRLSIWSTRREDNGSLWTPLEEFALHDSTQTEPHKLASKI